MGQRNPICWPDQLSWEVCGLPGAWIWDVVERLWSLFWPLDYYPLPFFHVGTNVTARGDLEHIKCGCMALGMVVNTIGAHLVSSSILPMRRKGLWRSGRILQVNKWLHSWCQQQGLGFYEHGTLFEDQGLLERGTGSIWQSGSPPLRSRIKSFHAPGIYKTIPCCEKQDQSFQERRNFLPTSWDGLLKFGSVWLLTRSRLWQ